MCFNILTFNRIFAPFLLLSPSFVLLSCPVLWLWTPASHSPISTCFARRAEPSWKTERPDTRIFSGTEWCLQRDHRWHSLPSGCPLRQWKDVLCRHWLHGFDVHYGKCYRWVSVQLKFDPYLTIIFCPEQHLAAIPPTDSETILRERPSSSAQWLPFSRSHLIRWPAVPSLLLRLSTRASLAQALTWSQQWTFGTLPQMPTSASEKSP